MLENSFFRILNKTALWCGVLIFFGSCSQKAFENRAKLMAYVNNPENGYTKEKSINGIDFSITYRPTDMLVSQQLSDNLSEKLIDSLRAKYQDQIYFNVTLSKNKQEILSSVNNSRNDFGAMVNQLAFGMGNKAHLFTRSKDTIELLDYIYPRMYGMGGATNILFVYPRKEVLDSGAFFYFTIEDIGFSTGEVGFKVATKPLVNEPRINF
ncbi:hypothetical protein B4Q04_20180 [Zobellia sp. OII3]|uniref:hypothetical protein n=1 Tax=Zobellia sp. OII3 TaxID=2034520 RepID=UPI000B53896F|nr:hypothetical protein [Zobellia sp. OII3]OWW23519.1 hypothetical protein B4Q04_20180 [Zobellia sp. OII3]